MIAKSLLISMAYLMLFFSFSFAQTITNYSTTDGLVNNSVSCLSIAPNGDIWFGTQEGVSHFGNNTWITHDTASGVGFVHNTVQAIKAASNGTVWIGTDYGVSKYDGINWTTYTEADGLADNRIKCIEEDSNGVIWFGNNDGVTSFDGNFWTSYTISDGLPFGGVRSITENINGDLWFGTDFGGAILFDGLTFNAITETDGLLNDKVRHVALRNDLIWVATADGISVFNSQNQLVTHHTRPFTLPAPDTLNPIVDLAFDSKGNLWTAVYVDYLVTEGGISWYNGGVWAQIETSDGLAGPVVRDIEIDANDAVWVATSTGVSKISNVPGTFVSENIPESNSLNVYPNPAHGFITVEIGNSTVKDVLVYNSLMELVKTHSIKGLGSVTMDLSVNKGIYFIQVGHDIKRVVVN